jgi:metal-sulfur cluster biosynthetic enzyme
MERDLENANPTILNVSQLPSRQRKGPATRHGPDSKCDSIVFPQHHWPFGSSSSSDEGDDDGEDHVDAQDIYDLISTISDPEHPHTLGQLSVVRLPDIHLDPSPAALPDPDSLVTVSVELTPTINHCSLATVIGLAVRCRLEQTLPPNYRVDVRMKVGAHAQDDQVNKQLGDKERVAAALENDTLQRMVDKMLETCA